MDNEKWYFPHESAEDRLWYGIFFSMCKKFCVSWPTATSTQKAFIEEITRVNYERELVKKELHPQPVRVFLMRQFPPDPNRDPYGVWSRRKQWSRRCATLHLSGAERAKFCPAERKAPRSRVS